MNQSDAKSASAYDDIPYPSFVFRESHPDRLASIATLFGMTPPSLATATVLELGCASGGNLVPMALSMPRSRCIGVDLSSRQIETAKKFAQASGAKNAEFRVQDLNDISASFGTFDYIVCHGVFSWVTPALQKRILEICSTNLSPNGVAYVSYNTLPGWNMYRTIRDMMLYHTKGFKDPAQIVGQARAFLDFTSRAVAHQNSAYSLFLATELQRLQRESDAYLLHDHLEVENNPVYFHDFITLAEEQGLRYLGEAMFHSMALHEFPAEVRQTLRQITDKIVSMEQYSDFLRNRTFRSTLLCRKDIKLQRKIEPAIARSFHLSTSLRPADSKVDQLAEGEVLYTQVNGTQLKTAERSIKAMLMVLSEAWPQRMTFDKLLQAARAKVSKIKGAEFSESQILDATLQLMHQGVMEFSLLPLQCMTTVSARPSVHPMVRAQCADGFEVTNQRHERVLLSALYRFLAGLCDGSRDKAALSKGIDELITNGTLAVREGRSIPEPGPGRQEYLKKNVEAGLQFLAQSALLTA